jgi:two-component system cell cycle response regulator
METAVIEFPPSPDPTNGGSAACLVVIYGPNLGKRYVLDKARTVIGRDPQCDIVIDGLDSVSRNHCTVVSGEGGFAAQDLGSKNGTFVDGREIEGPTVLASGSNLKIGGLILKFLFGDSVEAAYHEAIYQMTIVDALTQCSNKRYLLEFLERELSRSERYSRALSLLMLDLDHFKEVNDNHGHLAGDHVLREVAGVIKLHIRKEECFARYGGEEFCIVLPEAPADNALQLADKLRASVESTRVVFDGRHIPVTISVGVATLDPLAGRAIGSIEFIQAADARLYRAKELGRNRVVGPRDALELPDPARNPL